MQKQEIVRALMPFWSSLIVQSRNYIFKPPIDLSMSVVLLPMSRQTVPFGGVALSLSPRMQRGEGGTHQSIHPVILL